MSRYLEAIVAALVFGVTLCVLATCESGCSDNNARRVDSAFEKKSYSDALDGCIEAAQDGGAPYALCEERVDAQYGRSRRR